MCSELKQPCLAGVTARGGQLPHQRLMSCSAVLLRPRRRQECQLLMFAGQPVQSHHYLTLLRCRRGTIGFDAQVSQQDSG
jgi:hypothetical protein